MPPEGRRAAACGTARWARNKPRAEGPEPRPLRAAGGCGALPHEVDGHAGKQEYADAAADYRGPREYLCPPLHGARGVMNLSAVNPTLAFT